MVVAAVAAATALGSFVPSSGLLEHGDHPATAAAAPRSVGPRPAGEAAPARTTEQGTSPTAVQVAEHPATAPRPQPGSQHHPKHRAKHHPGHRGKRQHHRPGKHRHANHRHANHRHANHRHKEHAKKHHRRAHPVPVHARGADVSWPQCGHGLPMPRGKSFVVVGLTNGPAFDENPCVERQVRWAKRHHLHTGAYAVASYPNRHELRRHGRHGPFSHRTLVGRLRNVGFAEAKRAVATMRRVGLHPPLVWVDVEPAVRRPWSHRARLNAAVVHGVVHGYRHSGHRVGFYSTAHLWRQIVGPVRYRAPEWRTAGPSTPQAALARCRQPRSSIQGGRPVIAQWWTTRRDHDALCPGSRHPDRLRLFFHKY